jgi:hypothetical protein
MWYVPPILWVKKHRKINEKPFGNTTAKTKEFCI